MLQPNRSSDCSDACSDAAVSAVTTPLRSDRGKLLVTLSVWSDFGARLSTFLTTGRVVSFNDRTCTASNHFASRSRTSWLSRVAEVEREHAELVEDRRSPQRVDRAGGELVLADVELLERAIAFGVLERREHVGALVVLEVVVGDAADAERRQALRVLGREDRR